MSMAGSQTQAIIRLATDILLKLASGETIPEDMADQLRLHALENEKDLPVPQLVHIVMSREQKKLHPRR